MCVCVCVSSNGPFPLVMQSQRPGWLRAELQMLDTRANMISSTSRGETIEPHSATPGPSGPGQRQQANRPNFRPTAVRLQGQMVLGNANQRIGQTFVLPQCDSRAKWCGAAPTIESTTTTTIRTIMTHTFRQTRLAKLEAPRHEDERIG